MNAITPVGTGATPPTHSIWRDQFRHSEMMAVFEVVELWRTSTGRDRRVARVDGLCKIWNFKRANAARMGAVS